MRTLTPDDKEQAFIKATRRFPDRYAEQIAKGMDDTELATALGNYLGISGGSGARGEIDIAYQGAGLKIWASWNTPNSVMDKPIFEGRSTIAMARKVYGIANPDNDQLALF